MTDRRAALLLGLWWASPLAADGLEALLNQGFWERPISAQGKPPAALAEQSPLADLEPAACGQCHPRQHEAWRDSFHALALSPGLLGQLQGFDEATRADCLACHAPRSEQVERVEREGAVAALGRAGVECAGCHVRDHRRHGPRDLPQTPHGAVEGLGRYREASFCAPCHQFDATGLAVNGKPLQDTWNEYLASPQAAAGVTCQACHMPDKVHAFKGIHDPAMTRQGLALEGSRTAEGITARAWNRGAAHALPTYVTPRILLTLEEAAGAARREHVIARRMRWSAEAGWEELADDRLPPGQSVELALSLPPEAAGRVTVRVEPDHDYHARVYPALLDLLAGRLDPSSRALLEQARQAGGETAYTLYRLDCPPWSGQTVPCWETTP